MDKFEGAESAFRYVAENFAADVLLGSKAAPIFARITQSRPSSEKALVKILSDTRGLDCVKEALQKPFGEQAPSVKRIFERLPALLQESDDDAKLRRFAVTLGWQLAKPQSAQLYADSVDARDWASVPLEDLDLCVRSFNCLKRASVNTLADLKALSYEDLLKVRNIGKKGVDEVVGKLEDLGWQFPKPQTAAAVNSTINFAGIDWRVLAVEDNKALLISKRILEGRPYHTDCEKVTWGDCSLREYLNGGFYNRLSKREKSAVAETSNTTANNSWYGTSGGDMATDKVFLLSLEEMARYFGDSGALEQKKGSHITYFCVKNNKQKIIDKPDTAEWCSFSDQYNSARVAYNKAGKAQRWWLRSPGDDNHRAAYVFNNGSVDVSGVDVGAERCANEYYGVRPALWLNL